MCFVYTNLCGEDAVCLKTIFPLATDSLYVLSVERMSVVVAMVRQARVPPCSVS